MGMKQIFFFLKKKIKMADSKKLFFSRLITTFVCSKSKFSLMVTTNHDTSKNWFCFRPRTIQFNLEWCLLSRLIQASTQESYFLLLLVKLTHLLVIYFCSCKSHILKTNFCSQILTQKINPLYGERFRDSYSAVKGYVFIFTSSFPPLSSFDENIFLEFSFYYHILRIL